METTLPSPTSKAATPLMQQYLSIKQRYADEIVFFRLGDFYEMFFDDAIKASPLLEVTLTQRQAVPMCGVPYHAATSYIAKLLKAGISVAIAEQLGDPKETKGIVKRDVVRVMTPGTLVEDEFLSAKTNNFLVAIAGLSNKKGSSWSLAAADVSTGAQWIGEMDDDFHWNTLKSHLAGLNPSEILLVGADPAILSDVPSGRAVVRFVPTSGEAKSLPKQALAAIQSHLSRDHSQAAASLQMPQPLPSHDKGVMFLDETAIRHLELVASADPARLTQGRSAPTLLGVLDQCVTAVGSRLLRWWLLHPSLELNEIQARLSDVENFVENATLRGELRAILNGSADIERIAVRAQAGSASPRDLDALRFTLRKLPEIKRVLGPLAPTLPLPLTGEGKIISAGDSNQPTVPFPLTGEGKIISGDDSNQHTVPFPVTEGKIISAGDSNQHTVPLPGRGGGRGGVTGTGHSLAAPADLMDALETQLSDEPPTKLVDGSVIREGFNAELDELRGLRRTGKKWIAEMETQERERTGIGSLKVGYNDVFGYYLEVSKTNLAKVPSDWIRKQTMANGERYITPALKEQEEKILGAEDKITALESRLYLELVHHVASFAPTLRSIAETLARWDVLAGLAETAMQNHFVKPEIVDSNELCITGGRHPVVERQIGRDKFIPNDVDLNTNARRIAVITGPNMAGKSTYLRQSALIAIMAQMGSFVPAEKARIGLVDKIFTRIGASDRLAQGQSTFMVEMQEVSSLIHNCGERSLLILDEVGRGTSTYDGVSIAWAVIEHLSRIRPRALFATHYFELTQLEGRLPGVFNAHATAKEWPDADGRKHVVFLYQILPGAADRSYGIHVAEMAGLPNECVERAREILKQLESGDHRLTQPSQKKAEAQLDFFGEHPLVAELRDIKIDQMTPLEALNQLSRLKKKLDSGGKI